MPRARPRARPAAPSRGPIRYPRRPNACRLPRPRDRYTLNDLVGQSHGLFQIGPYEGFREDIELVSGQGAGQHSR
jgi:hypothetical protein